MHSRKNSEGAVNTMNNRNQFLQKLAAFLTLRTPLGSYGELVLRPVMIVEQSAGAEIAFSTAHNKK